MFLDVTTYHADSDEEIVLHISCSRTGYDNTDVGGGGPNELDDWSIDDWYGTEPFELTSSQEATIVEACSEALAE